MGYVGNTSTVNYTSFAKQDLTGVTGSPAKRGFTLSHSVANANEIAIYVNNVRQEPTDAYTVNGTGLTMTGDVEASDDFYVIFLGKAIQTTVPPDGSVGTAKIADSAVTNAKIADSSVTLAKTSGLTFGKILQAVGTTFETGSYASSTSAWTGTGMSVAITPSSTSSKILLMVTANGYQDTAANYYMFNVHRHSASIATEGSTSGATRLFDDTRGFGIIYGNSGDRFEVVSINYIDSPNTTSQIYYNCTHKKSGGSPNFNHSTPTSSMVVLEVGA